MNLQFITGKPVTTTNFNAVQPLGVGGQLVLEQWEVLFQILKHEMSPQCAGLLLEPVIDRQRGEVDWYLPADLNSLAYSAGSRDALLQNAHRLIAQAKQLAQRMVQSSDVVQRQKGAILEQALSYPTDEYIIETPYGPALVAWGHQSNETDKKAAFVTAKGDQHGYKSMSILPAPNLANHNRGIISYWPWLFAVLLLLILTFLPWWEGLIPMQYCRYYWLGPLILLLLLVPLIAMMLRNRSLSVRGR
ncbi:unnamed protein product [Commensalibacter communis]|uniref:hypothetical protein n=1 Tax=Commensalibacter communis TaxID=2972786 RepID=UPI0022FF78B0|nr:hypothetical protein [Commensalibacter communis]CAI3922198.1 unnamed protein product [Commensalibacter communis]CAI3937665.1 unnamed protein product [Commensalibacter communis]